MLGVCFAVLATIFYDATLLILLTIASFSINSTFSIHILSNSM